MGRISTHVLDTACGRPAASVKIEAFFLKDATRLKLCEMTTNADGRTDEPILEDADMPAGLYELIFHVGDYLLSANRGAFYETIPLRFRVDDGAAHYHVPLLITPWSYATYRGS